MSVGTLYTNAFRFDISCLQTLAVKHPQILVVVGCSTCSTLRYWRNHVPNGGCRAIISSNFDLYSL